MDDGKSERSNTIFNRVAGGSQYTDGNSIVRVV